MIKAEVEEIKRLPTLVSQGYFGPVEWIEREKVLEILSRVNKSI